MIAVQVAQLKCAVSSRERDHLAHSADCEAQLVRLRSEVTRISQSYEQLKVKRYQRANLKEGYREQERTLEGGVKKEVERLKLCLHLSNEKLRTAMERVALLEAEDVASARQTQLQSLAIEQSNPGTTQRGRDGATNEGTKETFLAAIGDEFMRTGDSEEDAYAVLQPLQTQETTHLLEEMFDKHSHQFNHEIHKLLAN